MTASCPTRRKPSRPSRAAAVALAAMLAAALGLSGATGCDRGSGRALTDPDPASPAMSRFGPPTGVARAPEPGPAASKPQSKRSGHDWFPFVPGRTSDFRITRAGVGVRYLRATLGVPESFFGRLAYPWVYSAIPGQVPDTNLIGLRQYFAVGNDGALQFVGAQNNGFMSYTDPPVRFLLADPEPLASWEDTVLFRSFLPGGIPFFEATQVHSWRSSARTHLRLEAGSFQALRTSATIATPDEIGVPRPAVEFARLGVAAKPSDLANVRGFWFARRHGVVARDYPPATTPGDPNINSYELIAEGLGPIPPSIPVTP